MTKKNPLQHLSDFGQSVWYDNLSRQLIESGGLQRLIDESGVVGITSNPTIFDAAISKSDDYDDQIRDLAAKGRNAGEIYEALTVLDIQSACDILRPIYDRTQGLDGYVSLEVSPVLAHDTEATMSEARKLHRSVSRPNLMVKIPGTPEGIPAVEQMLYEGININITLLFSLQAYREVMAAYLRAVERRLADGKPVDKLASVASFFVSRVDSEVDKRLEKIVKDEPDGERAELARSMFGTFAIANARLAYQEFKAIFTSDRFGQLAGMGARVQRPLWASTSTKNPAYSDNLYVDELIGPNTVQTLAPASIEAFGDHGVVAVTVEKDLDKAREAFANLERLGIAYDDVIDTLVREGVDKFADSFKAMIDNLDRKREQIADEVAERGRALLGPIAAATDERMTDLRQSRAAERLSWLDASFWSDDEATKNKIANRLGWLLSVDEMRSMAWGGVFRDLSAQVRQRGYQRCLLLGMGGSSLAPEVMAAILPADEGFPALEVVDTTNPDTIQALAERARTERTLFIVSSKSGTTVETSSLFRFFLQLRKGNGDDFIVVTDPGSRLEVEARNANCWKVITNRHDIGGRYSALSYFGLVPAAAAGLDIDRLLEEASELLPIHDETHPGIWLGAALAAAQTVGRDKLTILASGDWVSFGDWLEQLVAESTGKLGTGIVPVVREPLLPVGQYGNDRLFAMVGDPDPALVELSEQLHAAGHPVIDGTAWLGDQFLRWEIATAVAGQLMGINPFDEPNVQEAKDATNAVLSGAQAKRAPASDPADALGSLLRGARSGDYVTIMAYVAHSPEVDAVLRDLRATLGRVAGLPTTLGYGPRFLHSTGQLHKGGRDNGVFLQVVQRPAADLTIPDAPYTFGELFAAQSTGDYFALEQHGRRVWRIEFTTGEIGAVRDAIESLDAVPAGSD
jgi:transaldolase/glucose-6-phosphate isomerase